MQLMKNHLRVGMPVLLLASFALSGCCSRVESEPKRPAQVRGWHQVQQEGVTSAGEFVLTKNSTIENTRVGIELKEIVAGRSCRGTESVWPKAVVRFYRVADKHTLVELELTQGNTRLINFNRSLVADYGVDTVSVRAINTKDGWIWFDLLE